MKTRDGFIQGYNAQAAVDVEHQIIVPCDLTSQGADTPRLLPLIDQIKANTETLRKQVSADGFASDDYLRGLGEREIDALVVAGRQKHPPGRLPRSLPRRAAGWRQWHRRLPKRDWHLAPRLL